MSIDSKLFVCLGKEHLFEVVTKVQSAIKDYFICELDKIKGDDSRMTYILKSKETENPWYWVRGEFSDLQVICLNFGIGEARALHIFPDCSCDNSEIYQGDKIIFSLGCWGKYKEIMEILINTLTELSDVYYDFNDCDDEDFVLYPKKVSNHE